MKKKIKCEICLQQLEKDTITSKLIKLKNRIPERNTEITNQISQSKKEGLISPSDDVVTVCKIAEKVIRSTPNLFSMKNVLEKLIIHAKKLLSSLNLFPKMDLLPEKAADSSHKLDLINLILKKYFDIRLRHEAKCSQDTIQRIRQFHTKLVLFQNRMKIIINRLIFILNYIIT